METILINKQRVYYQVSGSNSCPSSAITMWLICQNLSGQLAGETMGTSLHRDWKANSRGSFMETRAPEHKPWKTARNISCDGSRTAWNRVAMLMCTIWKLNAVAELVPPVEPRMENQHGPHGRWAPGARVRHLTQEATKCRGKFLTGQNVERLQRLLIALQRRCWINHSERSKQHPDIHKPLLRSGIQGYGFQSTWLDFKAFLPLRTRVEKQKSCTPDGQTSMTQSVWADKITVLHPGACYYIWAGLWLKSHSIQSQKYRLASNETTRLKWKVMIVLVKHLHPARPDVPPRWQSVIFKHPPMSLWEKHTNVQTCRFGSFVEADCKQAVLQKALFTNYF